jgi:hypothetical protein
MNIKGMNLAKLEYYSNKLLYSIFIVLLPQKINEKWASSKFAKILRTTLA